MNMPRVNTLSVAALIQANTRDEYPSECGLSLALLYLRRRGCLQRPRRTEAGQRMVQVLDGIDDTGFLEIRFVPGSVL
jgi:hypothetical protein